jgi:hypothetical protein
VITSFSSAGPTDFDHQLKPDLRRLGGPDSLRDAARGSGRAVRCLRRHEHGDPPCGRRRALLIARILTGRPAEVKSGVDVHRPGPAWGDTARTQEASVLLEGAGLANVPRADDPKLFTKPVSLSFRTWTYGWERPDARCCSRFRTQAAAAGPGTVGLQSQAATTGAFVD